MARTRNTGRPPKSDEQPRILKRKSISPSEDNTEEKVKKQKKAPIEFNANELGILAMLFQLAGSLAQPKQPFIHITKCENTDPSLYAEYLDVYDHERISTVVLGIPSLKEFQKHHKKGLKKIKEKRYVANPEEIYGTFSSSHNIIRYLKSCGLSSDSSLCQAVKRYYSIEKSVYFRLFSDEEQLCAEREYQYRYGYNPALFKKNEFSEAHLLPEEVSMREITHTTPDNKSPKLTYKHKIRKNSKAVPSFGYEVTREEQTGKILYKCKLEGEYKRAFFVSPTPLTYEDESMIIVVEDAQFLNSTDFHPVNAIQLLKREIELSIQRQEKSKKLKSKVDDISQKILDRPFDESAIDTMAIAAILCDTPDETNLISC